jgi:hypothetical protein
LIVSPLATGQEASKADSPSDPKVVEARVKAVASDDPSTIEVDELIFTTAEAVTGQNPTSSHRESPMQPGVTRSTITHYTTQAPVFHARTLAKDEDALESNFGLTLSDADDALRSQLEIPAGQGVVVVGVKPGSLAEHAGLKQSDVLLSLGDQKADEVVLVKKKLLGLGKDALEVKLIREGKPRRMSLVGPEHGFPPEAAEYWIGVPVSPIDATLRTHLPALTADAGLVVNDVVKGSPADAAGIQKNDILVTMGGKPLKTPDTLIEQIQAAGGKPVPVEIIRAGKPISLNVTPAKRVHPTTINVLSRPGSNYRFVRPNVGIELDGKQTYDLFALEAVNKALGAASNKGDQKPLDLQLRLNGVLEAKGNEATGRIEAQLKEISTKLEQIQKAIDDVKKTTGK